MVQPVRDDSKRKQKFEGASETASKMNSEPAINTKASRSEERREGKGGETQKVGGRE